MSISIGSDYIYSQELRNKKTETTADKLTDKLSNMNLSDATDEQLMEACKSFEQYLVEQVVKSSKEAFAPDKEEEDNAYMKLFGDTLYQEYSKILSENSNLGIAKMLYESMKNNTMGGENK